MWVKHTLAAIAAGGKFRGQVELTKNEAERGRDALWWLVKKATQGPWLG
jgi:hypothetical protein